MKFNPLKKSINMTKTSQSGRSMTEIIGVLILIGILSVGALAGYGWAVDKYRSNTLNREVLQRAVDIKNQLDRRHKNVNLDKFKSVSLIGVEIGLASGDDDKIGTVNGKTTVGIQVDHVPGRICQMTFDGNIGLFDIRVEGKEFAKKTNENTSNACSKDKNTMIFYIDDAWEYNRNKPTEPETTENCPTINCTSSDQCLHGESCINGCCVEDTEAVYTSDVQMSTLTEMTSNTNTDIYTTQNTEIGTDTSTYTNTDTIISTEPTTSLINFCPAGQRIYCAEENDILIGDDGSKATIREILRSISSPNKGTSNTPQGKVTTTVYHSTCTKWACTTAPLILQDPTRNVRNDIQPIIPYDVATQIQKDITEEYRVDGTPGRDLEVPLFKSGAISYCALEYNGKCALVTYCDGPVYDVRDQNSTSSKRYQKRCSACTNPLDQKPGTVCVGNQFKNISALVDGKDALIFYKQSDSDICVSDLPPCEGNYYSGGGGTPQCCSGTAWGPCGSCGGWQQYTDNCGNTIGVADVCCGSKDNEVGGGCVGLSQSADGCYENFPINNQSQCCAVACTGDGGEFCCDSSTKNASEGCCARMGGIWASAASDGDKCCESENDSIECCEAYGDDCVYDDDMGTCCCGTGSCGQILTTTPYNSDTTSPYNSGTTSPYNSDTTSPLDSDTTSPYGSDTTSPYGSDTTSPEPTTPTGTGPTTTTPSGTGTTPTTTTTETTTPRPTTTLTRTTEITAPDPTATRTTETTAPAPTTTATRTTTTATRTTETTVPLLAETTAPAPTTTTPRPTTTLTRTTEITAPTPMTTATRTTTTATRTTKTTVPLLAETTAPAPMTTATRTTEITAPTPATTTTRTTTTAPTPTTTMAGYVQITEQEYTTSPYYETTTGR